MRVLQFISLLDLKARMSLKSEASKLYLSYLWWVLEPVLWVMAFYFVFTILLGTGRDISFLMCGKIPFLWFSKSVIGGSNSIVANRGLISQANIPKQFFVYESLQEVLYKQWLVFLVLGVVLVMFGYQPSWHWLWIIPIMVIQYLFILLFTLIGGFLVAYARDVRMLINMSALFLMFMSGVFWDLDQIQDPVKRELLVTWNPLAYLIDAYRQVLMHQQMFDVMHALQLTGVLLAGLIIVHVLYRFKSKTLASKVINS